MAFSRPPEALLGLAPVHLPNRRKDRYFGDNLHVDLEALAVRDQTLTRQLYARLSELLFAIADTSTDDARKWQDVAAWVQRNDLDKFVDEVGELGTASHAQDTSEALAKAMHDVRGGALSSLLGRLQMLDRFKQDEAHLKMLFVLARDHLKIMRSAIVGLDEPRRRADQQPKNHDVYLILDKWHESVIGPKWHEQPVRMHVDCSYQGALTECCLESAAIDRIFYNLANNACRHSAGERLNMVIFPIPEPPGESLRFVLSNQVNAWDKNYLHTLLHGEETNGYTRGSHDLSNLFGPATSSTGSGFGLTVVADFVAAAYGLQDRVEALRKRYVGAVLEGDTFRVWFHWPVVTDKLPAKLDDYHRPDQSLSEP